MRFRKDTRISIWSIIAFAVSLTVLPSATAVPPPPPRGSLPGSTIGKLKSRWLAPYVCATTERVGEASETRVRWFNPDGGVARTFAGPNLTVHHEFISDHSSGKNTIHGVHSDWSFGLPDKPGEPGYITASTNGRTFLRQFYPEEHQIAVDVYLSGELAGTLGPFVQYRGRDVRPAADGSLALLAWKTESRNHAQVVVAGPDGKIQFQVACDQPVDSPEAAPSGKGVLVRLDGREEPPVRFRFLDAAGTRNAIPVGPNAHLVAWVPETATALFATSIGDAHRYKLIDCRTGDARWEIREPVRPHSSTYPSVAVDGDHILFGGIEFAAVDIKTGEITAHWHPDRSRADAPRFVRWDDRLFVVGNDQFTEIRLHDFAIDVSPSPTDIFGLRH